MAASKIFRSHGAAVLSIFKPVSIIFPLLAIILALYLVFAVWQLYVLFRYRDIVQQAPAVWPEVTVLIAARNEEAHLETCLEAVCNMDYPSDKLHIVVGNDQSTDRTREIALGFQARYSNVRVVDVVDDQSGLKAKARVMAQMDPFAKGEFYLVTDADVVVKSTWAKWLVRHMQEDTGVASGTTMVVGKDTWSNLQGIDWAYFMGLLNIISYSGVPATAVGNNMILRSEAYWQTGGYAAIKFSITEDYKLYSEVCKKGWKWNNIMTPEVLAYSGSTKGFLPLLHQRKRWLTGGKELPWYWWILFGVFGLYYFALPAMFLVSPAYALVVATLKMGIQYLQINRIFRLLGQAKPGLRMHLAYEGYLFVVTISTALFFLMPFKTIWKGRRY
jgi:cellulose synthase/poly-beta-1,6-N-acetylglucosamine synthase-like glycosyltransferase